MRECPVMAKKANVITVTSSGLAEFTNKPMLSVTHHHVGADHNVGFCDEGKLLERLDIWYEYYK